MSRGERGDRWPVTHFTGGTRARETFFACFWPAATVLILRLLSASWYSVDLSGMPDEGPVPTALIPWFLYNYPTGGSVWSDPVKLRTWLAACGGRLVPGFCATVR